MLVLAEWGRRHVWPARLLILATHVYMGIVGFELGVFLLAKGVSLPALVAWSFGLLFIGAAAIYPRRRQATTFGRRKFLDGVLIGTLALLWVAAGNRFTAGVLNDRSMIPLSVMESVMRAPATPAAAVAGFKSVSKGVHKIVQRHLEKRMARLSGKGKGIQLAGVILLGILGFLALAYLTIALSCSLSCSGNEVAAVLVLVLGLLLEALLVWGIIVWARRIRQGR